MLGKFTDARKKAINLKKKLKVSQQKSRRLSNKVISMQTVLKQLKQKELISTHSKELISKNFSGIPLAMFNIKERL